MYDGVNVRGKVVAEGTKQDVMGHRKLGQGWGTRLQRCGDPCGAG